MEDKALEVLLIPPFTVTHRQCQSYQGYTTKCLTVGSPDSIGTFNIEFSTSLHHFENFIVASDYATARQSKCLAFYKVWFELLPLHFVTASNYSDLCFFFLVDESDNITPLPRTSLYKKYISWVSLNEVDLSRTLESIEEQIESHRTAMKILQHKCMDEISQILLNLPIVLCQLITMYSLGFK